MALRKNTALPSALFLILVLAGILGPLISAAPKDRWCDASEPSVICARNWANAAGNVFAFIAASVAAFFAFGQWRAGNRQAQVAMLPALKETFSAAQDLIAVIADVELQLAALIENDKLFVELLNGQNISADIIDSFCDAFTQGSQRLDAFLQKVLIFERKSLIFTGLEQAYNDLYVASLHLRIRLQVTGNALRLVGAIAQARKGTVVSRPSTLIPQPDLAMIMDAVDRKISSRNKISNIRRDIEESADVALIRRSKALAD